MASMSSPVLANLGTKLDKGCLPSTSDNEDNELLQAVLEYLKKKNLRTTEAALRKEADIQGSDDAIHIDKMKDVLTNYKSRQQQEKAINQYQALCEFVEKSLEMYRGELGLVIYPLFVQIYIELILSNQLGLATEFYYQFKDRQEGREEDINELITIRTKEGVQINNTFSHYRTSKYVVRMCKDSFNCLLSHLQDNSHVLLLNLINMHLFVDVFDGIPKQPSQLGLSNSTIMGDGKRSVNEQKMFYGVVHSTPRLNALLDPDEFDDEHPDIILDLKKRKRKDRTILATVRKGKTDMYAPPAARIPYPPQTEAEITANIEMTQEYTGRYRISHGKQPTIAFYTFLNAVGRVNSAAMSEDCKLLTAACNTGSIKIWSLSRQKLYKMKEPSELQQLDMLDENILDVMMDTDRNSTQVISFYGHNGPVHDVAINYNKSLILSGGNDSYVRLWSLQTHSQLMAYRGHDHPIWRVEWSPLGHYFVSGGSDQTVLLWSMQHIAPVRIFCGHFGDITSLVVHPNGNYVASGSSDRTVRVWDFGTGNCVRHLTGHKGAVTSLQFSPHGHLLISGDEKGGILIWDMSNGENIGAFSNHTAAVTSLALTREGACVISGGMDNLVNTWDLTFVVDNADVANSEAIATEDVLINASKTKHSPILHLTTTRKNLVMGVGIYAP